jgi:hypothetical protein
MSQYGRPQFACCIGLMNIQYIAVCIAANLLSSAGRESANFLFRYSNTNVLFKFSFQKLFLG